MLNEWENKSVDFKNAFYRTSSLNEEVRNMLTYGKGPKVLVDNISISKPNTGTTAHIDHTNTKTKEVIKESNIGNGIIVLILIILLSI